MSTTNQHKTNLLKDTDKYGQLANQVTERVEAPENIRFHAHQQPETFNHEEMMQTLLHDLKNPLSIIYMSACLLQQQENLPAPHKKEPVESILESVQDMQKLISDWLNLSKIQDGAYQLQFEYLPFFKFVDNCVKGFSSLAKTKNITLEVLSTHEEIVLEFDRDRMIQAINNLISNAIKYTPDNGEVTVTVTSDIETDCAIVKISDTGIGIAKEALPHIFDRFYRTKQSYDISGTGLGLAICKAIIERHNGSIEVESVCGKGTTFTFKLPFQQQEHVT